MVPHPPIDAMEVEKESCTMHQLCCLALRGLRHAAIRILRFGAAVRIRSEPIGTTEGAEIREVNQQFHYAIAVT